MLKRKEYGVRDRSRSRERHDLCSELRSTNRTGRLAASPRRRFPSAQRDPWRWSGGVQQRPGTETPPFAPTAEAVSQIDQNSTSATRLHRSQVRVGTGERACSRVQLDTGRSGAPNVPGPFRRACRKAAGAGARRPPGPGPRAARAPSDPSGPRARTGGGRGRGRGVASTGGVARRRLRCLASCPRRKLTLGRGLSKLLPGRSPSCRRPRRRGASGADGCANGKEAPCSHERSTVLRQANEAERLTCASFPTTVTRSRPQDEPVSREPVRLGRRFGSGGQGNGSSPRRPVTPNRRRRFGSGADPDPR